MDNQLKLKALLLLGGALGHKTAVSTVDDMSDIEWFEVLCN